MKVHITKILRITPGGFHAWCESDIGVIRKPTNNINLLKVGPQNKSSLSKPESDSQPLSGRGNMPEEYIPNETAKTSLLAIAGVFGSVGGAMLPVNIVTGSILLLISVGILVLRGYLKAKNII